MNYLSSFLDYIIYPKGVMKKYLGTSKSINPRNRLTSDIAFLEAISGIFSAVRHTHIPCELIPLWQEHYSKDIQIYTN